MDCVSDLDDSGTRDLFRVQQARQPGAGSGIGERGIGICVLESKHIFRRGGRRKIEVMRMLDPLGPYPWGSTVFR